jgi:hypothetical protein
MVGFELEKVETALASFQSPTASAARKQIGRFLDQLSEWHQSQLVPYTPSASVINAIFVNATTTMVGFGSMMIAAHRGLYSLGLVLTLGVGTCLLVSVITVPAILTWLTRHRAARSVEPSPADPSSALEELPQTPEFGNVECGVWNAQFEEDARSMMDDRRGAGV